MAKLPCIVAIVCHGRNSCGRREFVDVISHQVGVSPPKKEKTTAAKTEIYITSNFERAAVRGKRALYRGNCLSRSKEVRTTRVRGRHKSPDRGFTPKESFYPKERKKNSAAKPKQKCILHLTLKELSSAKEPWDNGLSKGLPQPEHR